MLIEISRKKFSQQNAKKNPYSCVCCQKTAQKAWKIAQACLRSLWVFPTMLLPEIGPDHCFCLVTILTLQIPWTFVVRTEDDDWKRNWLESLGLFSSGSTFIKSAPSIWAFPGWGEGRVKTLAQMVLKKHYSTHLTRVCVVKSYLSSFYKETSL